MRNFNFLLIVAILFSSCAVSRKVKYDNLNLEINGIKTSDVTIVMVDKREAVVDGSREPNFVGYMRSGAAIAYPMKTKSGNELTKDLSNSIIKSLQKNNINASILYVKPNTNNNTINEKLQEIKTSKKMLFVLNELHTDGYGAQKIHYNIDVKVFDKLNNEISSKSYTDVRKIGGTVAWGAGKFKKYMPVTMKELFEEIFNDVSIKNALNI